MLGHVVGYMLGRGSFARATWKSCLIIAGIVLLLLSAGRFVLDKAALGVELFTANSEMQQYMATLDKREDTSELAAEFRKNLLYREAIRKTLLLRHYRASVEVRLEQVYNKLSALSLSEMEQTVLDVYYSSYGCCYKGHNRELAALTLERLADKSLYTEQTFIDETRYELALFILRHNIHGSVTTPAWYRGNVWLTIPVYMAGILVPTSPVFSGSGHMKERFFQPLEKVYADVRTYSNNAAQKESQLLLIHYIVLAHSFFNNPFIKPGATDIERCKQSYFATVAQAVWDLRQMVDKLKEYKEPRVNNLIKRLSENHSHLGFYKTDRTCSGRVG
jgi:hypothetical protein